MVTTTPFFTAVVGFLAAVGGGVFQAWAARNFEEIKFRRQLRADAYLAYVKGIGELSFAHGDEINRNSALAKLAEARSRVAIFGSREVIERMNCVFSNGDQTHSPKARADLGCMLKSMRNDALGSADAADADALFMLTFGDVRETESKG